MKTLAPIIFFVLSMGSAFAAEECSVFQSLICADVERSTTVVTIRDPRFEFYTDDLELASRVRPSRYSARTICKLFVPSATKERTEVAFTQTEKVSRPSFRFRVETAVFDIRSLDDFSLEFAEGDIRNQKVLDTVICSLKEGS